MRVIQISADKIDQAVELVKKQGYGNETAWEIGKFLTQNSALKIEEKGTDGDPDGSELVEEIRAIGETVREISLIRDEIEADQKAMARKLTGEENSQIQEEFWRAADRISLRIEKIETALSDRVPEERLSQAVREIKERLRNLGMPGPETEKKEETPSAPKKPRGQIIQERGWMGFNAAYIDLLLAREAEEAAKAKPHPSGKLTRGDLIRQEGWEIYNLPTQELMIEKWEQANGVRLAA
jgi:hypothetical protein